MNRRYKFNRHKHTHSRFARFHKIDRKSGSRKSEVKYDKADSNSTLRKRVHFFLQRQKIHHENDLEIRRKSIESASAYKESVGNTIRDEKSKLKDEQNILREHSKSLRDMKYEYKKAGKALKKAHKHTFGLPSSILTALFTSFGIFLVFVVHWVITTWPKLKMDELIYQLSSPIVGTAGSMILQFVKSALVPGIAFFLSGCCGTCFSF